MRIYLAARYTRRDELLVYKADLEAAGHEVTSRWLAGAHQWDGLAAAVEEAYEQRGETPPEAVRFAQDDIEDLTRSDLVIAFTERPRMVLTQDDVDRCVEQAGDPEMLAALLNMRAAKTSRGGRHVELGMAIALDKPIFVVGPRENVFCTLPGIEVYADWKALLDDWPVAWALTGSTTGLNVLPCPTCGAEAGDPCNGEVHAAEAVAPVLHP